MARNIPPLNPLRVFDTVARHGSFTKAADELHGVRARHCARGRFRAGEPAYRLSKRALLIGKFEIHWCPRVIGIGQGCRE
jgi:hypothetical protein